MAGSLQKYLSSVDHANSALSQRWAAISNHLRYGLTLPVPTSAILLKTYDPPNEFVGEDGKKHRKPIRALYGFGQAARERFDHDVAVFERYCGGVKTLIDTDNSAVDQWRWRAQAGDQEAVRWYCKTVLPSILPKPPGGSAYLASGYSASERHLVIERYVADIDVIPDVQRYDVARNLELRSVEVPFRDRGAWYLSILAQVALLSADRIYRSEIADVVETTTVNCLTVLRDPATGHRNVVCMLSVSVPRQRFVSLNLLGVDPVTCVHSLGGRLTPSPGEYVPVMPWVKAEATGDLVIAVADTPLLQMNPAEFEQLVAELMRRMGLRAQSTGKSGDGGVDCVAFDDRPVVGGKVIIQVKRYANTVSPSVVRDFLERFTRPGRLKAC
jgi:restriction system protein